MIYGQTTRTARDSMTGPAEVHGKGVRARETSLIESHPHHPH